MLNFEEINRGHKRASPSLLIDYNSAYTISSFGMLRVLRRLHSSRVRFYVLQRCTILIEWLTDIRILVLANLLWILA